MACGPAAGLTFTHHARESAVLVQAIRRLTSPWQWLRWSTLEVVDCSMTSPAPIEAPVQRRGLYEHDSV